MSNPTIQLSNVSKRFGDLTALNDVSLEIHPGGVFAILGENGAGKTTAIRILLGLEVPDSGVASVLGLDSAEHGREIRRRIGYVPEQPALYPWMTVDEIGWFSEGFYPDGYLERYRELTARFGLDRAAKIKSLSKGMRSKVSLSLAMAHDPEVLILDEPTSGLDAMVRREFLESMVDWAAQDRTVLLCSHQINEVERVADTVAMVRGGQVVLVEKLDAFKLDSRQVIVTLSGDDGDVGQLPWPVISSRKMGRQWQYVVSDWDPSGLDELEQREQVSAVETHSPSLEELFVAHMTRPASAASRESFDSQSASTEVTS
ncbi:MAG: ABC transporter ATP-binding protein [Planctomycetota bacterium]